MLSIHFFLGLFLGVGPSLTFVLGVFILFVFVCLIWRFLNGSTNLSLFLYRICVPVLSLFVHYNKCAKFRKLSKTKAIEIMS